MLCVPGIGSDTRLKISEQLLTGPWSPSHPLACSWSVHIVPFLTPDLSRQGQSRSSLTLWLSWRRAIVMKVPRRTMGELALEGKREVCAIQTSTVEKCYWGYLSTLPSLLQGKNSFPINTLLFAPAFSHPCSYILFKHFAFLIDLWCVCPSELSE